MSDLMDLDVVNRFLIETATAIGVRLSNLPTWSDAAAG
jgi:hypothetical protein